MIGNEGTVRSIAVTPDGRWGLTVENSSEARAIRFWDFVTGTELHAVFGMVERGGYNPVGLTPDGLWALVAIAGDILVWNVATGEHRLTLEGHDDRISALAIAEDGRQALSGGVDGSLVVWDLSAWQQKFSLSVAPESVHELAITPDGCHGVALIESKIVLWDLVQRQEIAELPLESGLFMSYAHTPLALSPDGKRVYFGSPLHLWQPVKETAQALPFDHGSGAAMAILPSGDLALVKASDHETLEIWDIQQGIRRRVLPGQRSSLVTVVWTPDGRTVVASLSDHSLKVWALEYTAASVAVAIPGGGVDITPDGKWAISSDRGSVQRIWDFDTGEEVSSPANQDAVAQTMQCVWRECAARLASAESLIQERQQERDANAPSPGIGSDEPVTTPNQEGDDHTGYPVVLVIKPKRIFVASNGIRAISQLQAPGKTSESEETGPPAKSYALSLWDLTTPNHEPVVLMGHSSPITAVAMTPDGRRAVSGCIGRTVRVWDLELGCEIWTLCGHGGAVWDVRVTPDGHYAVSASGDRSIRIWDVDSGHCVAIYTGDLPMRDCAVSDEGARIAARDVLGRVHLLHLQALS